MKTKKIVEFRDPVIEQVVDKFIGRSDVGFKKYGVTLEDDPGDVINWVNHIQEELMDAVNYLQKLQNKLEDKERTIDLTTTGTLTVCQCCHCRSPFQHPFYYTTCSNDTIQEK